MKTCSRCKTLKPIDSFLYCKSTKDNLGSWCKPCRAENAKQRYNEIESVRDSKLQYCRENKERMKKTNKKWREANKEYLREYDKKQRKQNPAIRMRENISNRMKELLEKGTRSSSLVGCTGAQLKAYLESLFQEGMTWDNYGLYGWHVDHKKPISSFDLSCPEQIKECFHYTNLQPLWAKDNLSKGAKIV